MPGPVSDSYDPEFGTGENAANVKGAVESARNYISECISDLSDPESGNRLKSILELADAPPGLERPYGFDERTLRIIRFAMNRALESL